MNFIHVGMSQTWREGRGTSEKAHEIFGMLSFWIIFFFFVWFWPLGLFFFLLFSDFFTFLGFLGCFCGFGGDFVGKVYNLLE